MKKKFIVRSTRDFQDIIKNGKCKKNKSFIIHYKTNNLSYDRYGISVSKKVGNSIVRHRITRLVRESYRLNEESFRCGYDLVVIARAGAKGRTYQEIESALLHLGNLHKILV